MEWWFILGLFLVVLFAISYASKAISENNRAQLEAAARQAEQTLTDSARSTVEKYARTLAIRRSQLIRKGDYDRWDFDPWFKHIDEFIENVVKRDARAIGIDTSNVTQDSPVWHAIHSLIDEAIDQYEDSNPPHGDIDIVTDGASYESYVKRVLEHEAWDVQMTPASGDQGVDLIARMADMSVAIQCKFYSVPVGNKAVQEAVAGRVFYRCKYAAVVSNQSYTVSAKALAKTARVALLHHDELKDLHLLLVDLDFD